MKANDRAHLFLQSRDELGDEEHVIVRWVVEKNCGCQLLERLMVLDNRSLLHQLIELLEQLRVLITVKVLEH